MSLKSFIGKKEISSKLKEVVKKPKIQHSKEILAEPQSKNYTIVGIAFDYLLRMYIYRANLEIVNSFEFLGGDALSKSLLSDENYKIGVEIAEDVKYNFQQFINDGVICDKLMISCLRMSHLDLVKRVNIISDNFGSYDKSDVIDLKNMSSLLKEDNWKCKGICALNPNFGISSVLVGGADADLIMDDLLIDIKAIKSAGISRQYFNQILGYYILNAIENKYDIKRIGIYSARYAEFIIIKISDIVSELELNNLISWFREKAYLEYGPLYELEKAKQNYMWFDK